MKNLKWGLCICVVAFFVSCGYRFEGGGYIKNDVMRVAVKVLENKTSESGADVTFTNALIREIIQKTDTKVVDESRATAVFEGTIKAINFTTLSRSTTEAVIERRAAAIIDLKLIDKDGDVIWSVKDFTSSNEYTVSEDKITDESNKREAVDKIAIRTAEKVITNLMTNF